MSKTTIMLTLLLIGIYYAIKGRKKKRFDNRFEGDKVKLSGWVNDFFQQEHKN